PPPSSVPSPTRPARRRSGAAQLLPQNPAGNEIRENRRGAGRNHRSKHRCDEIFTKHCSGNICHASPSVPFLNSVQLRTLSSYQRAGRHDALSAATRGIYRVSFSLPCSPHPVRFKPPPCSSPSPIFHVARPPHSTPSLLGQPCILLTAARTGDLRVEERVLHCAVEMAGPCVGVDLGATHCVVAVCRKGKVDVIANDSGSRTTPSVVGFLDGESFVGEAAKDLPVDSQMFDAKLLLGRSATDPVVLSEGKDWPFQVVQEGGVLKMKLPVGGGGALQPYEVTAKLLESLKDTAEMFLAQAVSSAVLTVPPYFSEAQREATRAAGARAGLRVLQLLPEPEAAATAYGLDSAKAVLVLHVGGRSLHAWVRPRGGAGVPVCRHETWGGSLFDRRLADHLQKELLRGRAGVTQLGAATVQELRALSETTKRKLSAMAEVPVSHFFSRLNAQFKCTVSRACFESLCADLFAKIVAVAKDALSASGVRTVDEVVLTGGSARMPRLRAMVKEAFKLEPRMTINPDEVVAQGAAVHAAKLTGEGAPGREVALKSEAEPSTSRASPPSPARTRTVSKPTTPPVNRKAQGTPIGIDLGTTYSVVAVCKRRKVDVIANDCGSRTTPSVVGFLDGESFVGEAAKDLPAANRVFDAKRLIGRSWKDLDVQADRKHWPFEVVEDRGVPRIRTKVTSRKEMFAPEEISAMVLRSLKESAGSFLGEEVSQAVITVPAYFNERQRQATVDAGKIAGLEVMSIINEPTAAAIAYGLDKVSASRRIVLIFDLGGGTFDVSVMRIEGADFTVLASDGDTHLGGQDFDIRLVEHFMKDINAKHGIPQMDLQAMQDLRAACELAKRKLSSLAEAEATLFFSRYGIRYTASVTRARFEDLCADLFNKTMQITTRVLGEARVRSSEVDEVVLVGGSTRIPKVRALLSSMFGGRVLRQSINPDEAVAYGAAVRAAMLAGDADLNNLVKLKDVTPLSLGVNVIGERMSVIIPRNTPVPCARTERYYTCDDDQDALHFKVYQGERKMLKDNHFLNKECRVPVPLLPAGQAKCDVTFKIDADGLLTMSCAEYSTGAVRNVTIKRSEAALGQRDIDSMIARAEKYRKQDEEEVARVIRDLRRQGRRV
ncbi:Heat shock protein 70 B2, partial [Frankliniella fusca]